MFSNLKSMVGSGKDATASFAIKQIVNLKAKKTGASVEALHINSKEKYIVVTLLLKGETEPLTIKARNYAITTKNDNYFLEVEVLEKSRPWENKYIDGKRYKIPPEVLKAAEFIL